MGKEVKGYYTKEKTKLLKDFNLTIKLMKKDPKHRETITDSLEKELNGEYDKIIPEIPYFKGYRQRMFNNMLIITSQALAVYRVLEKQDKSPAEVWELCHTALELRLKQIPQSKKRFMSVLWSSVFRKMMMGRAQKNLKETMGHFELEYISGDQEGFDYGINYTKCGHHKFLADQEAEELLPYICLADLALSEAFGWGLTRSQTIGDGCGYCDFRFTKGAPTKITSKTPKVQGMIDRLTA